MNIDSFINKYKLPILYYLLKDEDIELCLYFKNNKLAIPKIRSLVQENSLKPEQRRVSKLDIDDFIQNNHYGNKLLTDKYIITENDLETIMKNITSYINISKSRSILWSDDLISKYRDKWNWINLSSNTSIHWSKKRILKFEDFINFNSLSYNINIEIDREILYRYEDKWDWNVLSGNRSVGKQIGSILMSHSKSKWVSYPENNNYRAEFSKKQEWLSDKYPSVSYKRDITNSIKPCICTNQGIKWNLQLLKQNEQKIDVWLLVLHGKLNYDIIVHIANKLNENRVFYTKFTRYSDWRDDHPVYRNGWENLLLNNNISINIELLDFLSKQEVTLIKHSGNAMNGHSKYEESFKANELVRVKNLDINFEEACRYENAIPNYLLSTDQIDESFYIKIIKPKILDDDEIIYEIANKL